MIFGLFTLLFLSICGEVHCVIRRRRYRKRIWAVKRGVELHSFDGIIAKGYVIDDDYHKEFDGETFLHYMDNQLLPALGPSTLLVLDQCLFHKLLTAESQPCRSSMKKQEVFRRIKDQTHCPDEEIQGLNKAELLDTADQHRPEPV